MCALCDARDEGATTADVLVAMTKVAIKEMVMAIRPSIAAQVIHFFHGPGEYSQAPSGFTEALLKTCAVADQGNLFRMVKAFPGYASAVMIAKQADDGIGFLTCLASFRTTPEGEGEWPLGMPNNHQLDEVIKVLTGAIIDTMPTSVHDQGNGTVTTEAYAIDIDSNGTATSAPGYPEAPGFLLDTITESRRKERSPSGSDHGAPGFYL